MIVIVDYGMGNLYSIRSAIEYLGAEVTISADPSVVSTAGKLILPGVGSFRQAMVNLRSNSLAETIAEAVLQRKTPILGICLGMKLLAISSTEDGYSEGFGFIDTPIERFGFTPTTDLRIPHVGFESVSLKPHTRLFKGMGTEADFYFTHSYRMAYTAQTYAAGTCVHGDHFIAAFEQGHIVGAQFHPEKSQTNGLLLLKNFIENF